MALTSSRLEPVPAGEATHSVFARAVLAALKDNRSIMDGMRLFKAIERRVRLEAGQTPIYGDIRRGGHEGGDFLFVRAQ